MKTTKLVEDKGIDVVEVVEPQADRIRRYPRAELVQLIKDHQDIIANHQVILDELLEYQAMLPVEEEPIIEEPILNIIK